MGASKDPVVAEGPVQKDLDRHEAPRCPSLQSEIVAYFVAMRIIRRYSNRKLYDTQESHYVTLSQVATLVRNGEEIRVIAKDSNSDLTTATLALIIFEEEKRGPRLPVSGLRRIIQTGVI
jgi:polyhydroxyalkanoate synthesis repressor PhaR